MDSSFGENVANLRVALKLSQDDLAQHAGISRSMLSKIERGEVNPTILIAGKLARSLNTTVSTLLGEQPSQQDRVGNIQKFVEALKTADEQLEKIIACRKEIETDFQATFHQTHVFDKEGRYLFVSLLGARYIGRSSDDMVGKHWRDLELPTAFMKAFEQHIMTVFSTEKPLTTEIVYPTPNGLRYFEYRIKPLINENGSVEAVIVSSRDTTNNRIAQFELANQISKLNQLIEICPIGIITVDRHGIISIVNQSVQTLLSPHSSDNWIGKDMNELLDWAGLDHDQAPLAKALRGEAVNLEFQNDRGVCWQTSAFPLRDITGQIYGAIAFFQNASDVLPR
ncbi:MAG: sensor signal transduction histidine kinase [Anaerosporomusa subterranea]|jgi:PAS domain S-box-containing protein|nr:sensor signal transduction histidine kinase [Anaerosporomusa subterranea]